ncbi:hypothetical protein KFK09_018511 [Dendrobium nobile]|uniref:Uncharacterized protein n=1 Tax=Dendrobium nobile TaxID=94219 RepID=A0A8T3AVE5_DENNO|nr:hypothetical protein KFK09_018511 [Dendrobium nobile]
MQAHSGDVISYWIGSGTQQEEEEISIPIKHTVPPKFAPDSLKKSSRNQKHQFWGNGDNEDDEPSQPLKPVVTESAKHWIEKNLEEMTEEIDTSSVKTTASSTRGPVSLDLCANGARVSSALCFLRRLRRLVTRSHLPSKWQPFLWVCSSVILSA